MDTFITYEGLPVNSGGAHSLGKRPPDKIHADIISSLELFANTSTPKDIELTFFDSQNDSYKTRPILLSLMTTFGFFPKSDSWDFGDKKQKFWTWALTADKINTAFQTLDKYSDLPDNPYGPIILSFKWHFKFADIETKQVLPNQNNFPTIDERLHNSQIYLRLSKKSTVSVWFAFPFQDMNEKNKKYIASVFKPLPFKPSDKHWRQWQKSKNGHWKPKRLELNVL